MNIPAFKTLGFSTYDIIDLVMSGLMAPETKPFTNYDIYMNSEAYQKAAARDKLNAWAVVYQAPDGKLRNVTYYVKEFVKIALGMERDKNLEFLLQNADQSLIDYLWAAAGEIINAFREYVTGERQNFTMWDRTSLTVLMRHLYPETSKIAWDTTPATAPAVKTAAAAIAAATSPTKEYIKYLPYVAALGLLALAV